MSFPVGTAVTSGESKLDRRSQSAANNLTHNQLISHLCLSFASPPPQSPSPGVYPVEVGVYLNQWCPKVPPPLYDAMLHT